MNSFSRSSGKVNWLLLIALLFIFGGGFLAYWTQTDGNRIAIRDLRFMGTDRVMMSGLLYVPPGVTAKNPAPGIVAVHGYMNSRETQDVFAIEFARRGYVVLAIDQTGHGFSDGPAFANGFGGPDGLRYLRSLDIVDPNNIGLNGHSMGGYTTMSAAGKFPNDYKSMVILGSAAGLRGTPEWTTELPRNLRLIYSQKDEFSKFMYDVPLAKDIVNSAKLKKLFGGTEPIQPGKLYGSLEAGTARQLLMPDHIHTGDHFEAPTVGMAIDWFQTTLTGGKPIPASDQIWQWKQRGTLIALIGMFLLLFPLGKLLLQTRFFSALQEVEPEGKPVVGIWWWVAAVLTSLIPVLTFFRFQHFVDAPYKASWLLPQNLTTGVMFWAVGNGIISLVLLLIWHFGFNRKNGATASNYGLSWVGGMRWGKVGRSFLLAAVIALVAYALLALSDWLFKTDFRFFVFAVKLMTPLHFQIFLCYLIPFVFFCLVLGVGLNGQLRLCQQGGASIPLGRALSINLVIMTIGIAGLLVYQYAPLLSGGTLSIPGEPLLTILAYQFIPLLGVVSLVTTYFFRKTGHVYVGAFLSAILVTWIVVAGQVVHYAF